MSPAGHGPGRKSDSRGGGQLRNACSERLRGPTEKASFAFAETDSHPQIHRGQLGKTNSPGGTLSTKAFHVGGTEFLLLVDL